MRLPIVGAVLVCAAATLAAVTLAASEAATTAEVPRSLELVVAALAPVEHAAVAARRGDAAATQRRYDLARALADDLAGITPGARCADLYAAITRELRGHVRAAEGFDLRSAALRNLGERDTEAGKAQVAAARASCGSPGWGARTARPRPLLAPLDGEAFFGRVRATLPRSTTRLELRWRGRVVLRATTPSGRSWVGQLPEGTSFGRGKLELTVVAQSATTTLRAVDVWHLPPGGVAAVRRERADDRLAARLATLAADVPGYAGIWVHELRSGRTAGWNADARFPAASTVKLGVLAASLHRYGPRPERSPLSYDMRALAAWSSNLAANRLLRLLERGSNAAGQRVVERVLRRMGAARSTYPGPYRVGTAHGARPAAPPLVSQRTTTARDLGRVLTTLHAAASGSSPAQAASGLSRHEARVGLALLLDTLPAGDNVGLVRPWLPATVPAAQKQGWLSSARHTAAIVYAPSGPVVIVLMTYGEPMSLRQSQQLGRKVVAAALG